MIMRFVFIMALLGAGLPACAQNQDTLGMQVQLMRRAFDANCSGDSAAYVAHLETYLKLFPDTYNAYWAVSRLATIYEIRGQIDTSIRLYEDWSNGPMKKKSVYFRLDDTCGIVPIMAFDEIFFECGIELGRLYRKKGDFDQALYYLNKADNQWLPRYGGCVNGIMMARTNLSLKFADHYVACGDTMAAIHRLLEYFLSNEGNSKEVTIRLRSLLLTQYTHEEIVAELNRAIETAKEDEKGYGLKLKCWDLMVTCRGGWTKTQLSAHKNIQILLQ